MILVHQITKYEAGSSQLSSDPEDGMVSWNLEAGPEYLVLSHPLPQVGVGDGVDDSPAVAGCKPGNKAVRKMDDTDI